VCSVRCGVSREGHGRDRLSLNYRSFMFGKLPPPACPGLCYLLVTKIYIISWFFLNFFGSNLGLKTYDSTLPGHCHLGGFFLGALLRRRGGGRGLHHTTQEARGFFPWVDLTPIRIFGWGFKPMGFCRMKWMMPHHWWKNLGEFCSNCQSNQSSEGHKWQPDPQMFWGQSDFSIVWRHQTL